MNITSLGGNDLSLNKLHTQLQYLSRGGGKSWLQLCLRLQSRLLCTSSSSHAGGGWMIFGVMSLPHCTGGGGGGGGGAER